jgi:two-component system OmpR family sensor kinase
MSRIPIRVRLTLSFAGAMALVLAAVGLFVYQRVANELLGTVDQTLRAQVREEIRIGSVDADTGSGPTLAQLFGPRGELRHSQPPGQPPLVGRRIVSEALAGRRVWLNEPLPQRGAEWRVLALRAPSHDGVVVLARSLGPRDESLAHLRHELLVFLLLALLAASLGGYALTAGALGPVELLRRRAESVKPGEPSRLPVPPAGDEISRLAQTLNEMLARLQAAVEHERRFVADASHELRTPLALLRTELDLALRRPRSREELEGALRSAADETERLSRLADDLLLIARADQGSLPIRREVVLASELLGEAATRFTNRASSLGRELRVKGTDLVLEVDPLRVGQALVNLVDNALTHGQGTVELLAEERGDFVELHVRDDGQGFPPEFRDRAFDRFSHADEARSGGGAGLGLSIVELVAGAHGGAAALGASSSGGADVWISLPRSGVPDAVHEQPPTPREVPRHQLFSPYRRAGHPASQGDDELGAPRLHKRLTADRENQDAQDSGQVLGQGRHLSDLEDVVEEQEVHDKKAADQPQIQYASHGPSVSEAPLRSSGAGSTEGGGGHGRSK